MDVCEAANEQGLDTIIKVTDAPQPIRSCVPHSPINLNESQIHTPWDKCSESQASFSE